MADSLSAYHAKRDFKTTPEPRGKVKRTKGRLYLIQKHDATRLHYDFRLELDGVLMSWAVTRGPSLDPADKRLAVHVEDHPVEYGGFEGVIPSGYGAGTVMLWDRGEWLPQGDPHEGLRKGNFKFVVAGERLNGGFALVRMKPKPGETSKRENWLLIKERDEWAVDGEQATETWDKSVKTGRDLKHIASEGETYKRGKTYKVAKTAPKAAAKRKPAKAARKAEVAKRAPAKKRAKPAFVAPQLALLKPAPPDGPGWLHEIKFDGYRIIAVINNGKVRLFTRNEKDWTARYARTAAAIGELGLKDAVIDGELVALDDKGESSFSRMQAAAEDTRIPLIYHAFDLLNDGGEDITALPLIERKTRLKALLASAPETIKFSSHLDEDGGQVIASACSMKLEGIISKRADAPYTPGRGGDWVKSKCIGSDEFVIGGYRLSDKRSRGFRSLLLGEFEGERLVYRGRVGTGFTEETFTELLPRLKRLERKSCPFDDPPAEARQGAVWVKPEIVAQIAYLETTPDGLLRHPSYLGLREDKAAKAVQSGSSAISSMAQAAKKKGATVKASKKAAKSAKASAVHGLRLTSPDKVLWPDVGLTKLDLATYLDAFSGRLLPHVKNRPLSIVRCPEGQDGECFFQKHHNPSTPDEIETVSITEKTGGKKDYLVIRKAAGVVAAAQISGVELHVWGAREDMLEKPERIVFDLDPDEGLGFDAVKAAALELRDVLGSLGLKSFPLLSGGKGVHVIVPIARTQGWDVVKAFSRDLSTVLAKSAPERYVAQASKAKRKGRIFLDWLRNERGATAIAPFSPRRRPGAPVATPVSWKELPDMESSAAFTLQTIGKRIQKLRSDPWSGYSAAAKQALKREMIAAVTTG